MTPFALVPGFATDAQFSIFRGPRGADGGFPIFRPLVETHKAVVFRWSIPRSLGFFSCMNPFAALALYRAERTLTTSPETQRRFVAWLQQQQPRVIVCHSLGCLLLTRTLQAHALPSSVKRIVLNQGDLSVTDFAQAVHRTASVSWVHTYCPWDPSLLVSSLLAGRVCAGLRRVTLPHTQSFFLPLWRSWNPHISALRDPQLLLFIER